MYYRVAIQVKASPTWQWKSTPLNSQSILWRWLQFYRLFPRERLRIFSSPSREGLNEQLVRENQGLRSLSVPAAQFLQERGMAPREVGGQAAAGGTQTNERGAFAALSELSSQARGASPLDKRREDLERGAGGDYDTPYQFALPLSITQVLAWLKLQARVQQGDLQGEFVACRNGELLWRKEENS
ncbi:MAG TPA: hypothetical protein VIY29_10040 [Ktedonobacteraceae bacterium]